MEMNKCIIRKLNHCEITAALPMVWDVFQQYEAVNYSENGKEAFYNAIRSAEFLEKLTAYGAFDGDSLIGIIASRNSGSHISLFFVKGEYHRQGVGRRLMSTLLAETNAKIITVNSSVYAQDIYKHWTYVNTLDKKS